MSAAMTAKMTKEFRSPPSDQMGLLLRSASILKFVLFSLLYFRKIVEAVPYCIL